MEHKYFTNQFKLFGYLDKLVEGLDLNRTLRLPKLWFSDVEGNEYKCQGSTEFCNKFNKVFNTNFLPKKSYISGKKIVLFFDEVVDEEEVVFGTHYAALVAIEDEAPEAVIAPEVVTQITLITPDWEWIDSLENDKEDKLKLDNYAEKFSVKLNRNKKLSNMINDFKTALEEKCLS